MRLFKRKNEKQVKFVPNQDFLHESQKFLKGKAYEGPIETVRYFERNGWIEGSVATPPPVAYLEIQKGTFGHRAQNVGDDD